MFKLEQGTLPDSIDGIYIRQWSKANFGVILSRGEIDFTECNSVDQVIMRLKSVVVYLKDLESQRPSFLDIELSQGHLNMFKIHGLGTIHMSSKITLGKGDRRVSIIVTSYKPEEEKPLYATDSEAISEAKGRLYLHYKGGIYQELADGVKHSEKPEESYVLYKHLWPHKPSIYARLCDSFYENVGEIPRFKLLKDSDITTEMETSKPEGRIYHRLDDGIYQLIADSVKHADKQGELYVVYRHLWPRKSEMFLCPRHLFYDPVKEKLRFKLLVDGPLLWDDKKK